MYSTQPYPASAAAGRSGPMAYLRSAEAWLDARGRGAWIATMIVGFIIAWPLGLALLAYMIWSKRMFSRNRTLSRPCRSFGHGMMQSSGNSAFDAYKEETLRRLQEEQDNFADFLGRLREAKDKAEFDQFMADRKASRPASTDAAPEPGTDGN